MWHSPRSVLIPNYKYSCVIIPWLVWLPTLEPRASLHWPKVYWSQITQSPWPGLLSLTLSLYVVFCIGFEIGIIIVPDAADIICGAKKNHVEQFCSTWQFCLSCGSKLLHMTINVTPHDKIACHVEQFYHVKQWEIALHLLFGSIHIQNCSTWQIYNVNGLFMIYAVLT